MISKSYAKNGRSCRVTFQLPVEAASGAVLGEFNDWNPEAHRLKRTEDGGLSLAVSLPAGRQYRFRYLLDGERWTNDETADAYVPNQFGSLDAVLDLADGEGAPATEPRAKAAAGATARPKKAASPAGPTAKPVAGKTAKPAAGPTAKPVPEKTAKPVTEKAAKPVTEKAAKPVTEKTTKPAAAAGPEARPAVRRRPRQAD